MISLQWDTSGAAFKRHCGITGNDHGARGTAMRHGAGMWARAQIASCAAQPQQRNAIVICEAPYSGGRFMELALSLSDEAEPL